MNLPNRHLKSRNSGFTLVELIIVIVILGILSAFIVPKFADIAKQARISSVEAMAGNLRAAAALAHAQQVAESGDATSSVTMNGSTVTMTNAYPTDNTAGIGAALAETNGFTADTTTVTGQLVYTLDKAPTSTTCYAAYDAAASTTAVPSITITTSGC